MATVEFALVLPTFIAVVLVAVGLLMALRLQLLCQDSARVGARVIELGGGTGAGVRAAAAAAPSGAAVSVLPAAGALERVVVERRLRIPGPLGTLLPAVRVRAQAVAVVPIGTVRP